MPKQLEDFDLNSLVSDYDPIKAVEGDLASVDLPEGDDFTLEPTAEDEDDGDTGTGNDDSAVAEDDGDPDASEGAVDDSESESDADESDATPGDDDTAADDAAAADDDSADGEEELIPGVDPKTASAQLKEKTQDRIRSLLNDNKTARSQVQDFQRRIAELEANQKKSGQTDAQVVDQASAESGLALDGDAIKQMFDKAVDGDLDTASTAFMDMMKQVASNAAQTATQSAKSATTAQQQQQALDKTVDQLTTDYSILDPNSPDFDQPLAVEIRDLRDFYVSKGSGYSEALMKAAEKELTMRGVWGDTELLNETPAKADTTAAKAKINQQSAAKKAKAQQPPAPGNRASQGRDKKPDLMKMSAEDFDKLTDAELEAMTGTQYS